jgi:hypothetical protein
VSTTYEFRLQGHVDQHWSSYLGDLTLRHESDGTSTLTGTIADQSALHGVLAGLRDLGSPLLSVRVLPADDDGGAGHPYRVPHGKP